MPATIRSIYISHSTFQSIRIGLRPVHEENCPDASFSFVTLSDAQDGSSVLPATANQASALNPDFGIFIGDLEDVGVTQTMMDEETSALGSLLPKMCLSDVIMTMTFQGVLDYGKIISLQLIDHYQRG